MCDCMFICFGHIESVSLCFDHSQVNLTTMKAKSIDSFDSLPSLNILD